MSKFKQAALLILLFSISINSIFAGSDDKNTNKLFKMLPLHYKKGEYKTGLNRIKTLGDRLKAKEGETSLNVAQVHAWSSLYYAAISDFNTYNKELLIAEEILKKHNNTDENYVNAALSLSNAYLESGEYQKANLWLSEVSKLNTLSVQQKTTLLYQRSLYKYKLGYYITAQKDIQKQLDAINKDLLNEKENAPLKALLTILEIDVLIANGKLQDADNLITLTQPWVDKEFSFKNGFKAELLYRKGIVAKQKKEYKEALTHFSKAYSSGVKYFQDHSPFLEKTQKNRILLLLKLGKNSEADYWQNDQDVKVISYYGKKSKAYIDHGLISLNKLAYFKQWDKALDVLRSFEEDLPYYPNNHIDKLLLSTLKSTIYYENNLWETADSTLANAIIVAESTFGKSSPAYQSIVLDQAHFNTYYSNDFRETIPVYKDGIVKIRKEQGENAPLLYKTTFDLIYTYSTTEKYQEAISLIDSILPFTKDLETTRFEYPKALLVSVKLLIQNGQYKKAATTLKTVHSTLGQYPPSKTKFLTAEYHRETAHLLMAKGFYTEALQSFSEADKIFIENPHLGSETKIEDLAILHMHEGKYRKTEKELELSLANKTAKLGEDHYSVIPSLLTLSQLHINTGDFKNAEKRLEQSKLLVDKLYGNTSYHSAQLLSLYKQYYHAIGNYKKAENSITAAVEIISTTYGKNNIKTSVPKSELALAIVYQNQEILKKEKQENKATNSTYSYCVSLIDNALLNIENEINKENSLYAKVLENAGSFYLLLNDLEKAENYITQAKEIWEKTLGKQNIQEARLSFLLGKLGYLNKEYDIALKQYSKSADSYNHLFNDIHPLYIESIGMAARMNYILGDNKKAINASEEVVEKSLEYIQFIFPNLSEQGKAQYWGKIKDHFEFYNTLAFNNAEEHPDMIGRVFDINLQTKAILLNASVKIKNQIIQSGNTELITTYEDWQFLKEEYISALSLSLEQQKKEGINIAEIEASIEQVEKYLSQNSIAFSSANKKKDNNTWEDVQNTLNNDEQVLEIIAFHLFEKDFSDSIWYVTLEVNNKTKNNPSYTINKNGYAMHNQFINYYRNCIRFNIKDEVSYNYFWKGIEPLAKPGYKTYISYDGVYNRINLETIKTPKGTYLLSEYNLIPIGTSRDLLANVVDKKVNDTNKESNSAFFLGDPTFYPSNYPNKKYWGKLSGTQKEISFLSKYLKSNKWDVNVYTENLATEAEIKKVKSPKVFHIATHGFYVEDKKDNQIDILAGKSTVTNPLLRSGLIVKNGGDIYDNNNVNSFNKEDGILTAYEAMNLSLENTDLVVLSACETGLGEVELGEGVFGLQRSFAVAGSKNVILSLFKVPDAITTELMQIFYTHWVESGNKRESFVKAKKEIMSKYDNPINWGAFIMIGT